MTKAETDSISVALLADALLLGVGAGLLSSCLTTMTAAADTFAARLHASTQHAAELQALQLRSLATSIADLRTGGRILTTSAERTVTTLPPGAPVVT